MGHRATSARIAAIRGPMLRVRARLRAVPGQSRAVYVGLLLWVVTITCISATTLSVLLFPGSGWAAPSLLARPTAPAAHPSPTITTAPVAARDAFGTQALTVAPVFQRYYDDRGGAMLLGAPITPALPEPGGWLQFYQAGALYLPATSPVVDQHTPTAGESAALDPIHLTELLQSGQIDSATGVTLLPIFQALLTAGSLQGVGGASDLDYAALRQSIQTSTPIAAPPWYTPNRPVGVTSAFVPEATSATGTILGHSVPLAFWQFLSQPASAPDGWFADYGVPLTEALPATQVIAGQTHHLLVQVFQRLALEMDVTSGFTTHVALVAAGVDYLKTFGPPRVPLAASTHAWATADATVRQWPNAASAVRAHIGARFPLSLTGNIRWVNGTLWYEAAWSAPRRHGVGWVPAGAVSFAAPTAGPVSAGIDVLDPALASYLAGYGNRIGVFAYDLTRGITYTSNPDAGFITGSSIKVPIMLALLAQVESQNRGPNGNELYWLNLMIEQSDNHAAQILYEEIGDSSGLQAFMRHIGVPGLLPSPWAWGWSQISPDAMAQMLTLLATGKILNAQDRALALNLMRNVEPDQQFGLGDTAPAGAIVAMKNGWVPGPDGLWAINTSGIVTIGRETYILTVFTTGDDYDEGMDIVGHVCFIIGQSLK